MTGLLLRDVEVAGARVDVLIAEGTVRDIGHSLPRTAASIVDGRGGALLPGLVDHHIHLHALAAREHSVDCGPPEVTDTASLAAALSAAMADEHGWVRGVGYTESVAGALDASRMDTLHSKRPVRLAHHSGAMWMFNSAAMAAIGLAEADHSGIERVDGRPTGRLWRGDSWLRERLPPAAPPSLDRLGATLARLGITSVTDATPDLDQKALSAMAALPQRVHVLGASLDGTVPDGLSVGPYKIVLADSDLPDPIGLAGRIEQAHMSGRAVAVHCVTREALILLLTAFEATGTVPGDRIEHAALVPVELRDRLPSVITQPGFLTVRGDDYRAHISADEHDDLYRCASLLAAGVPLALSSDAPHGPLDPWVILDAAVRRRTPSGVLLGPAERLAPAVALDAMLSPPEDPGGAPRRVRRGARADLVLLHVPLREALNSPDSAVVRATLLGGRFVP